MRYQVRLILTFHTLGTPHLPPKFQRIPTVPPDFDFLVTAEPPKQSPPFWLKFGYFVQKWLKISLKLDFFINFSISENMTPRNFGF